MNAGGTVVEVENLTKIYQLGVLQQRLNQTFRENVSSAIASPFRRIQAWLKHEYAERYPNVDSIYALKNVSFEIKQGEVVGVIGRNGAGKSTLLKILSRITEPSEGYAEIRGCVGSLLEVGTGFHPELTGRENIYLNGAILGMKKLEIEKKFDEIVSFAELERFLDTPVKHYSSGMYVRLAFAVAAFLEPDVLLVDEVLAVGDSSFQKKCIGKMTEVAKEGRTILFVSHNLTAIENLCSRSLLLDSGRLVFSGETLKTIQTYLQGHSRPSDEAIDERTDRSGSGVIRITGISVESVNHSGTSIIRSGDSLRIRISYRAERPVKDARFLVGFYDPMNTPLFRADSQTMESMAGTLSANGCVVCETGAFNLTPGPCYVNVAVSVGGDLADHLVQAAVLDIEPSDFYSSGRLFQRRECLYLLPQKWYIDEA